MTQIRITPASDAPTADSPMRRWLLHLARDEQVLVGEIQTPASDLDGRGWLVKRHLEGSGWAVVGPLERTQDGWVVDVVST